MKVERLYTRLVMATTRSAPIAEAAAAMRRFQVGTLLVMEDDGGQESFHSARPQRLVSAPFTAVGSTCECRRHREATMPTKQGSRVFGSWPPILDQRLRVSGVQGETLRPVANMDIPSFDRVHNKSS